jgi:uncharacterized membrane protein YhaH (DUF805 family)
MDEEFYAEQNIGGKKPRSPWWGFCLRWFAVSLVFGLLAFVLWSVL